MNVDSKTFLTESRLPQTFSLHICLLIFRCSVGALFIFSSLSKIATYDDSAKEFGSLGLSSTVLMLTIIFQFIAGSAIGIGLATRISAVFLAVFTVAATFTAHWFLDSGYQLNIMQATTFLEHLVIVAALMLMCATGPGKYAVSS